MFLKRDKETKNALQEIKGIEAKYTNLMMRRPPFEAMLYLASLSFGWFDDMVLLFSSKATILKKLQNFKALYNKLERETR